jgi:epoxyqueuosine reductase
VPTTVDPPRRVPAVDDLVATGRAAGLDAVGVTAAEPFATTRRHLEARRAAGLDGGMHFTYARPARSADPTRALPDARSLVVGARSYRRAAVDDRGGDRERGDGTDSTDDADVTGDRRPVGQVARYAWEDHYGDLKAALTAVARELKRAGWRARVLADDNALVDREAAYRAGLGWYGKNANLLMPGAGSWFVLGAVVTDAPLDRRGERVPDGCGTCTRCLDGCPTGAIVAPGVVDARRCLAWSLQVEGPFPHDQRVALGDRLYGCDVCQEVCPPNRRLDRAGAPPANRGWSSGHGPDDHPQFGKVGGAAPPAGAGAEPTVDLLDLLAADDETLLDRHGRWYVPRRQARYLRRNALVVLGNVADPRDAATRAALTRALADADPLVRGHAVWAARRLGLDDLVSAAGCRHDPDPTVRAEVDAHVPRR